MRFYPVKGKVTVDGKPGEHVVVVLHKADSKETFTLKPSGSVGPDGTFVIKTFVPDTRVTKDGAPAGKYYATCQWFHPDGQKSAIGGEYLPDKLQGKYAHPDSTKLEVIVREGSNELPPFELKR